MSIAAHPTNNKYRCRYGWRDHEAAVPHGYFLFKLVVERCNIHIALFEFAIEFWSLRHIRGATRVFSSEDGESTKPRFHVATFYSNCLLNVAIYTLLCLSSIELWWLRHIPGATRVFAGEDVESIKP